MGVPPFFFTLSSLFYDPNTRVALNRCKAPLWPVLLVLSFLCSLSAVAQDPALFVQGNRSVKTTIVRDIKTLQPTRTESERSARIGIRFEIEPGWHLYWQNSGEAGVPTEVQWHLPSGWHTGTLRWPVPYRLIERGEITTYGYENEVVLLTDLFPPLEVPAEDGQIQIKASVRWLVCKDICVPGGRELSITAPYSSTAPLETTAEFSLIEQYDALTPRPKAPAPLTLTPTASVATVKGGDSFQLGVIINGIETPLLAEIEKHVQLFPLKESGVSLGAPAVITSKSGEALIALPAELSDEPGESGAPKTVHGVLSLSQRLARAESDQAVEFTIPLPRTGAETVLNPAFPSLLQENTVDKRQPKPLTFREHRKTDEEAEETEQTATPAVPTTPAQPLTVFHAVLFALAAGFILNFMPCVLPVVSLKVMSVLEDADKPRQQILRDSLFFAAGILLTFLVLAATVIAIRQLGGEAVWGFAFQYPGVVFSLLVVVFLLSLASFDLYLLQLPGIQRANTTVDRMRAGTPKHLLDGVLATALSTPCTAPFLGTAIGFAFTQSNLVIITVFLAIGTGLSLPYLLLALMPGALKLLPRPGAWMVRVRELMGFFLIGTAIWLLFIMHRLTEDGVVWSLALLFLLSLIFWFARAAITRSRGAKALVTVICSAAFLAAVALVWEPLTAPRTAHTATQRANSSTTITWIPYSRQLLEESRAEGAAVFIDFTADWCITCKFNERFVLNRAAVAAEISERGIVPIKADWTTGSPEITEALKTFGGQGVPHYVLIPATGAEPIILPSILTQEIVLEALRKVQG